MLKKKNNSGFSIILAILMTGFMLIITAGVFLLVLAESKDTKSIEYYFKSLEGSEGGLELAMLRLKQFNYSYDEKIDNSNPISKVLFKDQNVFNKTKDVLLTYEISSIALEIIDKKVNVGNFEIIPLFSYNNGIYSKVRNISISGLNSDVVWNIVGNNSGISGKGNFTNVTQGNYRTLSGNDVLFEKKSISDFLNFSDNNYLIIHNLSSSEINYTLKSLNSFEYLTKDKSLIISSGEIGGFKQNLRISINLSEYLNLLKYSIFSN